MNHKTLSTFKHSTFFVILFFLAFGTGSQAFAQKAADDPSIPKGLYSPLDKFLIKDSNPPLRLSDVTRTAEMLGWVMDGRFSNREFEDFKQIVISEWQAGNQETINFVTGWVAVADKLVTIKKYADQIALKEQLLPGTTADLKKYPDDQKRAIARRVYRRAKGENSLAPFKAKPQIVKTSGTLRDILGDWLIDSGTGSNMRTVKFSFLANNDASFSDSQSGQKGKCFVSQASLKEGTVQVSGDTIKFDFTSVKSQHLDSCQPSGMKLDTLPAETLQYTWQIKTDENEMFWLCLTGADGKTACYRKKE